MAKAKTTKINPKTFGITGPTSRGSGRAGRGISLAGGGGGGFGQPVSALPSWFEPYAAQGATDGYSFLVGQLWLDGVLYEGAEFDALWGPQYTPDYRSELGLDIPIDIVRGGEGCTTNVLIPQGVLFEKLKAMDYCLRISWYQRDLTGPGGVQMIVVNTKIDDATNGLDCEIWGADYGPFGHEQGEIYGLAFPNADYTQYAGIVVANANNIVAINANLSGTLTSLNGGPAHADAGAVMPITEPTALASIGSYSASSVITPDYRDGRYPVNGWLQEGIFYPNDRTSEQVVTLSTVPA